jgi:4-alpha-glucanotransferase
MAASEMFRVPALRRGGILLHPTSLPGPFGIGDLGPQARRWVDFLAAAGQTLWQVLPLSPTGYGDSPYQCLSDFAGNALLISPELLAEEGLLSPAEVDDHPAFGEGAADYPGTFLYKSRLLNIAYQRLAAGGVPRLQDEFRFFCEAEKGWLDDFRLFRTLKRINQERPWWEWESGLARGQADALEDARKGLSGAMQEIAFEQFLFRRQWDGLRQYARDREIQILGDLPMYCAQDSADVWAGKRYYQLDEEGRPIVMAGVPPDYFSPTGQLWGNPIFDWDALRREGYAWWIRRARAALRNADIIRLDHFRGYIQYWAVPADRATAEIGSWVPGPGSELFERLRESLGGMPFVAEDLGVITEDVIEARDLFKLPGMRILQFAFDGESDNPFLPHNFIPRTAVYTGTHDNDTTVGWYLSLTEEERKRVDDYRAGGSGPAWDFIRMAWSSVAQTAICPMQDVLELGTDARMNYPGTPSGNWRWRFREGDLAPDLAARLRALTERYGRLPRDG